MFLDSGSWGDMRACRRCTLAEKITSTLSTASTLNGSPVYHRANIETNNKLTLTSMVNVGSPFNLTCMLDSGKKPKYPESSHTCKLHTDIQYPSPSEAVVLTPHHCAALPLMQVYKISNKTG